MNLQNRLEKLEAIAGNDEDKITAIFHHIIHSVNGKPYQAPIAGWRICGGEDIVRLEGESDESLAERATSIATANTGNNMIPRFIQIDGEGENIYE
jgi:hypothetical protein